MNFQRIKKQIPVLDEKYNFIKVKKNATYLTKTQKGINCTPFEKYLLIPLTFPALTLLHLAC